MDINGPESLLNHHMAMGGSLDDFTPDWMKEALTTGTTIMAAEFNGGVVIAADSRTTTGSYIANRITDKLTKVTDSIYCCRSGSAADTQAIADVVAYHMEFHEMETNQPPLVKVAANTFREMCYNYRDQMTAGIIVAGWDKRLGGQVYSIPLGGMLVRQPITIGGSGSTFLYGFMDTNYREGMTQVECEALIKQAVALAMHRDGSSGGVIRMGIITKDGIVRKVFTGKDIPYPIVA